MSAIASRSIADSINECSRSHFSQRASRSSNFGFESKNNNTEIRAKNNAGDVTQDLPTAGIGGRIGTEYENLKNYKEYVANGSNMIATFRGLLKRDLDLAAQRRAAHAPVNWDSLASAA